MKILKITVLECVISAVFAKKKHCIDIIELKFLILLSAKVKVDRLAVKIFFNLSI